MLAEIVKPFEFVCVIEGIWPEFARRSQFELRKTSRQKIITACAEFVSANCYEIRKGKEILKIPLTKVLELMVRIGCSLRKNEKLLTPQTFIQEIIGFMIEVGLLETTTDRPPE